MKNYSVTSYAVLGLLSRHPWSAYALNLHMRSSPMALFWPRAASRLYQEPKNLVDKELAKVHTEVHNGRHRSVYTITPKGEKALLDWISVADGHFSIESESLLKIAFSDASKGDIKQLHDQLEQAASSAQEELEQLLEKLDQYINDENYPDNQAYQIDLMMIALYAEILKARIRWANSTSERIKTWQSPLGPKNEPKQITQLLKKLKKQLQESP